MKALGLKRLARQKAQYGCGPSVSKIFPPGNQMSSSGATLPWKKKSNLWGEKPDSVDMLLTSGKWKRCWAKSTTTLFPRTPIYGELHVGFQSLARMDYASKPTVHILIRKKICQRINQMIISLNFLLCTIFFYIFRMSNNTVHRYM